MHKGTVKKWFDEKGYGSISGDDGVDYFIHGKNIGGGLNSLCPGDRVSFDIRQGKKGIEAYDVRGNNLPGPVGPAANPAAAIPPSFPYQFVERAASEKEHPKAFHDKLLADRYDVAFEVAWTTETPTALTPCEDPSKPNAAFNEAGENIGYNKRWLMIDGRPAISPFTVKGAVANAFANLRGGCYRVQEGEEGHNSALNAGTYPYTGKWKRYRVSMRKSRPGIIREIDFETGRVKVQPVVEYFWDNPALSFPLNPGDTCHATWRDDNHRNIIIGPLAATGNPGQNQGLVTYFGPYSFGMDLKLSPGDMGKHHNHRFYTHNGNELEGQVPPLSLAPLNKLLKKVYGGQYCKGDKKELKVPRMEHYLGQPWYERLKCLGPGDWCYYTTFKNATGKDEIFAIGKNFQFKALFNHRYAIPSRNVTCTNPKELCPRCALFGVTDKTGNPDKETVGYAGRFRAATLVADIRLHNDEIDGFIPTPKTFASRPIKFHACRDDAGRIIIRQFALPIMGPPKPSKRDVNGYFREDTGALKGAKRHQHSIMAFDSTLLERIGDTDHKRTAGNMSYAHQMRPITEVMREGVSFSGALGGENCSIMEIAALFTLLDRRVADHAFKIGLGKSIGLGSVSSRIVRVWVRSAAEYRWKSVEVPVENAGNGIPALVAGAFPEQVRESFKASVRQLVGSPMYHSWSSPKQRLDYGDPGSRYWQEAKVQTVSSRG